MTDDIVTRLMDYLGIDPSLVTSMQLNVNPNNYHSSKTELSLTLIVPSELLKLSSIEPTTFVYDGQEYVAPISSNRD
jgi:hypothetical protein